MYSAETIAVASTICILVSLSAGCLLGFVVATYRRRAVSDLASMRSQASRCSKCHWTSTSDKDGTEVVSDAGVSSVPLARLYAVLGSRHGTVTSQTSSDSRVTTTTHKACQTVDTSPRPPSSSKSTPTRRPASSAYRRVNASCPPNSRDFRLQLCS